VLPLLDAAPEADAVGLAADVEPDDADWLPDDAHPATITPQISAATTKASLPDPVLGYPALGCSVLGNGAPGTTGVPFMCAAPHAPLSHYDGMHGHRVARR